MRSLITIAIGILGREALYWLGVQFRQSVEPTVSQVSNFTIPGSESDDGTSVDNCPSQETFCQCPPPAEVAQELSIVVKCPLSSSVGLCLQGCSVREGETDGQIGETLMPGDWMVFAYGGENLTHERLIMWPLGDGCYVIQTADGDEYMEQKEG